MIRNLKVLVATAMALAAFGALSVTAHAAEEKIHCSVEPCRFTLSVDEVLSTSTSHHVIIIKGKTAGGAEASASFTCEQLTGEATSATKTATELTFTNLAYKNAAGEKKCKVGASETVEVNFTSCDYNFKSAGGSTSTAQVHLLCTTAGDGIDFNIKGTTCLEITPFTSTGVGYHKHRIVRIITAILNSIVVPNSAQDLKNVGNANCAALGLASTTGATYTTGNTLLNPETTGGVAAEAWFE